jgi:FixJ family two-component response regulator
MPNRRRVLIVEDDTKAAAATQEILPCFRVEVAGSIREAIGIIGTVNAKPISCILLDLRLPNGQGVAVVSAFQRAYPNVPMVVVTGMGPDEIDASRVIYAGAQDLLRKPVDPAILRETLIRAIVRHEVRQKFDPITEELEKIKMAAAQSSDFMRQAATDSARGIVPKQG